MIVINWDWVSFFVGIAAVLTVEFWVIMVVSFKQWKKAREAQKKTEDAITAWINKK